MSDFTSISLSEYVRLCSFIAKQRSGNWNIHVPKEGKCRSIGGIRAISGIKRESLFFFPHEFVEVYRFFREGRRFFMKKK